MLRSTLALFFLGLSLNAICQGPPNDPPRVEDHFWRRRIQMSIDLAEKVNRPLTVKENEDALTYTLSEGGSSAEFKKGLIYALLDQYRRGNITGYKADTLDAPLDYEKFERKYRSNYEAITITEEEVAGGGGDDFLADDEFGGDFDDFGFDDAEIEPEAPTGGGGGSDQVSADDEKFMLQMEKDFSTYLIVIEDRIFDKQKSDMYYDIKYFQLVFISQGLTPEAYVTFHYDEVEDMLDNVNWKNPHNDSEYRSLKEVFELRRFNSTDRVVSGRPVESLYEAQKRRDQMVDYEHNLWEY